MFGRNQNSKVFPSEVEVAGSSESILRTNLSAPRRANSKTLAFDPAIPERSERAQIPQPSELGILSLKQIRRASLVDPTKSKTAPPLRTCNGSLASSFYAPHPRPGSGVCLSPDGKYLLRYGFSSEIKLIDASTAALVCTFRASLTSVGFAAFSTDGKHVIAATDDCRLLVFDMAKIGTPSMAVVSNIDVGLEPLLYCLMSPDGKVVLSCDDDGQLELWGVTYETMVRRFEPGQASKLANFAMGGAAVISCSDGDLGVVLLETDTGLMLGNEEFEELSEGRSKPAYTISSDGSKVLAFTTEQTAGDNLAVYDTGTQEYRTMKACSGSILHAEFSASGDRFIAAGRDDLIHVYSIEEVVLLGMLAGHDSDVMFCRMSGDQKFAISGDNTGFVLVWDVVNFELLLRLQAHQHPVLHCDLSSDGTRAFSLDSEGNAFLWYLDAQGIFNILASESDKLCSCSASFDNNHMVLGYADGTLRLWKTGLHVEMVWEHSIHTTPVVSVGVNPQGGLVASASRDGKLVFTEVSSGEILSVVPDVHRDVVTDIEFACNTMLTSARDSTLKVWGGIDSSCSGKWKEKVFVPSHTLKASSEVISCALSRNSHIAVATCSAGDVSAWNTFDGSLLFSKIVSTVPLSSIEFSDNGQYILIGSQDGSTAVFDIRGNLLRSLVANSSGINFAYFADGGPANGDLNSATVVSVCALQAISWSLEGMGSKSHSVDFISDQNRLFRVKTVENRTFVAHDSVALYDPSLNVAMYDMRVYEQHPGDSYMFRNGTALLQCGVHSKPLVMYSPVKKPITMLMDETGGAKALDFSSDGHLLVCGNTRGELSVWDVENHQHMQTWMAHKRSPICCVKFSNDSVHVYSCGEDCKVILWDWRSMAQLAILSGHQSAVVSVEMSLNGMDMVSGDRDGIVILWDTISQAPKLVIAVHNGPVLGCTISPDGTRIASSGEDEHISIRDSSNGKELLSLDDALDGKGLTIKFSFDGTRLQVGGEKGNILVWSVTEDSLIFEINAHQGKVYDCSWSGDSRRLLSVGADGRVRLWDSAAGSEICEANFEEGFGDIDTGGFIRCDISSNGTTMAGCTRKGHLIQWDIHKELRRTPNGGILYKWLSSISTYEARQVYTSLLGHHPLIMNAQDSQGWTVLMHAVAHSNPEITKIIVQSVKPKSSILGLISSGLHNAPGISSGASETSFKLSVAVAEGVVSPADESLTLTTRLPSCPEADSRSSSSIESHKSEVVAFRTSRSSRNSAISKSVVVMDDIQARKAIIKPPDVSRSQPSALVIQHIDSMEKGTAGRNTPPEPNAIQIAIKSASADCVSHLLDAVLLEKVTVGSYAALTAAFHEVASLYPEMSGAFLGGLPLLTLGEMEIPASLAAQGTVVRASTSYTSFKEMWHEALNLDSIPKGPMVMMQASMVKLPYAASLGKNTILETLVNTSQVPVKAFGSETVKAIIDYKWSKFARRIIFTKALVYLAFIALFTVYAILRSDENPYHSLSDMMEFSMGQAIIVLSVLIFVFGLYYLILEAHQMIKLGLASYFDSVWNFLDLASYSICLVIAPCEMLRVGTGYSSFLWPLVAVECLMLWVKAAFFGLAVDGLGTFIYMTVEIVKGMRYFMLLLFILWLMFAVAFMNLFPVSYVLPDEVALDGAALSDDWLWDNYQSFGKALMTSYMTTYNALDPAAALNTRHPEVAIILICLFDFLVVLLFTNMLITLMSEVYERIRDLQHYVFLENRAQLVIEVESTMTDTQLEARKVPPFLHLLTPIKAVQEGKEDGVTSEDQDQRTAQVVAKVLRQLAESGELLSAAGLKPSHLDSDPEGGDEYDDEYGALGASNLSDAFTLGASNLSEGSSPKHAGCVRRESGVWRESSVQRPASGVRRDSGVDRRQSGFDRREGLARSSSVRSSALPSPNAKAKVARASGAPRVERSSGPGSPSRLKAGLKISTAGAKGVASGVRPLTTTNARSSGKASKPFARARTSSGPRDVDSILAGLSRQVANISDQVTRAMNNPGGRGAPAPPALGNLIDMSSRRLLDLQTALETERSFGVGAGAAGLGRGAPSPAAGGDSRARGDSAGVHSSHGFPQRMSPLLDEELDAVENSYS